ncbi:vWA domain-containing protein [Mariniblastus fucicola]|uniref:von Willebrand factor n=1 Tax=Mariniblastus fucicola TaxID=980251 RepID=A0A5B9PBG9_9BACT|nr:VWA domain-containing protein [Mariniblastus fucicola]QEG21866.1 von Willebrand factor [Mariniblastus fucicola]
MRAFSFVLLLGLSSVALVLIGCDGEVREAARRPTSDHSYAAPMSIVANHDGIVANEGFNTESYDIIDENEFVDSMTNPKSTFSIDVDTASYSNVRRMISEGSMPPKGAVRIEELVNYFDYNYQGPKQGDHPFSVHTDIGKCPWNEENQLVRIALKGKTYPQSKRPDCNLVFLLDVSGSMNSPRKLPLVKSAMRMLVENLDRRDQIAIVVYAGSSGVVLPSTPASSAKEILEAMERLEAGGSTNGGEGINLAYMIAAESFIEDGVNRVILCTDGDFNVGTTNRSSLVSLIEDKARSGISLSVLGFGTGNLKDDTMESLADRGNGNYAYIDSQLEARKALVEQINGTLITIAKDVKIQVDFNPARVSNYRLIGYENRMLENEDFADDKKDAGEIGAGHTVTALYEIVPPGGKSLARKDAESEFVESSLKPDAANSDTVLKVNLRYKLPDESESQTFSVALDRSVSEPVAIPSGDFQFAASVAAYGMLLRDSKFKGDVDWEWVVNAANESLGEDRNGYRSEFVKLARQASVLE